MVTNGKIGIVALQVPNKILEFDKEGQLMRATFHDASKQCLTEDVRRAYPIQVNINSTMRGPRNMQKHRKINQIALVSQPKD